MFRTITSFQQGDKGSEMESFTDHSSEGSGVPEEGLIERIGAKRGQCRRIERDLERMDWHRAACEPLDIRWPFGIEDYVELMPENIAVIAGEPNSLVNRFKLVQGASFIGNG